MPDGKSGQNYTHEIWERTLVNTGVIMNGLDLGSFRGEITLAVELDEKTVMHNCYGTRAGETFITGVEATITGTLINMSQEALGLLRPDLYTDSGDDTPGSEVPAFALAPKLFTDVSFFPVTLYECNASELPGNTIEKTINFYEGKLEITGSVINMGPQAERAVPIVIRCRRKDFTIIEVPDIPDAVRSAVFYAGDPSAIGAIGGIPAVVHP